MWFSLSKIFQKIKRDQINILLTPIGLEYCHFNIKPLKFSFSAYLSLVPKVLQSNFYLYHVALHIFRYTTRNVPLKFIESHLAISV